MNHIIIPTRNAKQFTEICIQSIKSQTNKNWRAWFLDDCSTDSTTENAKNAIGDDTRFSLIKRPRQYGALANIATFLDGIQADPDDLIIIVDGDDYLINDRALELITKAYEAGNEVITGHYISGDGTIIKCDGYPEEVKSNRTFRSYGWQCAPTRAFKYSLWKLFDHDYYLKENGEYFKDTYDQAMFYPLLELAGPKVTIIDEPTYKIGLSGRSDGESQERCKKIIVQKIPAWPPRQIQQPTQSKQPKKIIVKRVI